MSMRLTHEQFVARARSSHGNKYEYPEPYVDMKTPLLIICQKHGEFIQRPDHHLRGSRCYECNDVIKFSHESFIVRSNIKHGQYRYPSRATHPLVSVIIICPVHGEFRQKPEFHMSGAGCQKCGIKSVADAKKLTHETFISNAVAVHGDRYSYPDRYVDAITKIDIICNVHGIFKQSPNNHTNLGQGCPRCGYTTTSVKLKLTHDEFLHQARVVHGDRYSYPNQYVNGTTLIAIICPDHGLFQQKPNNHIHGQHGCPNCTPIISKPSNAWLDSIGIPDGPETREVRGLVDNKRYTVDGYDPATNTIFEFHGDYYHGHPDRYNPNDINPTTKTTYGELYERTQRKKQIFLDAGYKYVEMWESDWKRYVRNQ